MRKKSFLWIGLAIVYITVVIFSILRADNFWLSMLNWIIVSAVILLITFIVYSIAKQFTASPEIKTFAKVISKYQPTSSRKSFSSMLSIAFEFPDGSRKNIKVLSSDSFNTILEKEEGLLTYKEFHGTLHFINFEPQR